jgi:hypothetical protein
MSKATNNNLSKARKEKNDEFYTQYEDIEREVSVYFDNNPDVFRGKTVLLPCDDPEWSNFTKYFTVNFAKFGIKKLISTSFSFTDKGKIKINDNDWEYLSGNGDFRSEEVTKLRNEADIIVTNPPFSLFREFLAWIVAANKQFLLIGNMNAITYKEVFPLIKNSSIWMGNSTSNGSREFEVPDNYPLLASGWRIDENGKKFLRVKGIRWFTNLDHGRRHQPLQLMTMAENLKYSKHAEIKANGYQKYDNYDAIEIPFTDAIPSDYQGVMGVPISFLDKYCPEQFEIVQFRHGNDDKDLRFANGNCPYVRILIRHRKGTAYQKYDNYDAIEVPFTDAIPSDYQGVMGVPISFLDKYCPEQFEIIGCSYDYGRPDDWNENTNMSVSVNGINIYKRILIRHRKGNNNE